MKNLVPKTCPWVENLKRREERDKTDRQTNQDNTITSLTEVTIKISKNVTIEMP